MSLYVCAILFTSSGCLEKKPQKTHLVALTLANQHLAARLEGCAISAHVASML